MLLRFAYRNPFLFLLLPLITFILICYYTGHPVDLEDDTNVIVDTTRQHYSVVISSYGVERANTFRYEALCSLPHARTGRPTVVGIYLYLPKDSLQPCFGDTLIIATCLQRPSYLGSFDYPHYLRSLGIVATAYTRHWMTCSTLPPLLSPKVLQHRLLERYRELGLKNSELGTIAALTLGYRESIEPDIKQAFQTAGAMHVLAVSGLHTGILMSVLMWIFTGFGFYSPLWEERGRRIAQGIMVVILLWCYAAVTGFSPSVVRSVIMCTIVMVGYMCHRTPLSINTVCAAAFLIILFRPNDLFTISFQLSFAAVFGIILLTPFFNQFLIHNNNRIINYLRDCILVSFSAQLSTAPFTLYYFGTFSTYFLLTNIIVLPLAFILMVLALLTFTIGWIPMLGPFFGQLLQWTTFILNQYVIFIESLPGSQICL